MAFKATSTFDRIFEVGILLKGLDGLLEIIGGVLLLLIKPVFVNQLSRARRWRNLAHWKHTCAFRVRSEPHEPRLRVGASATPTDRLGPRLVDGDALRARLKTSFGCPTVGDPASPSGVG
jgi:Predicted membrane protein